MNESTATIFRAGQVYSAGRPDVEAFTVANGLVVATGGADELADRYPHAERIDLGERFVSPGFNDAHAHLADSVQGRLDLDVSPTHCPDVDSLIKRILDASSSASAWVQASGYDDSLTGELDRDLLDRRIPDRPVLVRQVSAHWAVLNSRALTLLGITEDVENGNGETYGRDATGRLNGRIYERALLARYVTAQGDRLTPLPTAPAEVVAAEYVNAVREWNALGLTSTTDALVGAEQLKVHRIAQRSGSRSIRVGMLLAAENYDRFHEQGFGTGFGDEWLSVVGIKAFVDGAVGGRTCFVSEAFCGTHDHGLAITSAEELDALVDKVHGNGDRLGVHANGDSAIRMLLDAYEKAQEKHGTTIKHRIEHCSIVDEEIIARIARLGLSVLPFSRYANFYGDRLNGWYGPERVARMFAHRSFLDAGVTVGASTDFPASPLSPFAAMASMVTRTGMDGAEVGRAQSITAEQALGVYTVGSASSSEQDGLKGRIEPGMLADFVVLSDDPRAIPGEDIAEVTVLKTFVGGVEVYSTE